MRSWERLGSYWLGNNPRHFMYAICAYIDPANHPDVGIYGIHGVSGNWFSLEFMIRSAPLVHRAPSLDALRLSVGLLSTERLGPWRCPRPAIERNISLDPPRQKESSDLYRNVLLVDRRP